MDIWTPTEDKKGTQFVVVVTSGYNKLTMAIPTTKKNGATVSRNFLERWVASYGVSSRLLTHDGLPFVSKLLMVPCSTLEIKNITGTEYHSQNNGQTDCYKSTLLWRLCCYVSKDQAV